MQDFCCKRIESITPENRSKWIANLRERTGLRVEMVVVEHSDNNRTE